MIDIIKHTPLWVFALFAGLIVLGVKQTRAREVTLRSVCVLPVAMAGLSVFGVYSAFSGVIALAVWFVCLVLGWGVARQFCLPKGVRYISEQHVFHIPGSKVPFILIMAIFFTKYCVGVMLAIQLAVTQSTEFMVIVSAIYGILSGIFLARGLQILQARDNQIDLQPA